MQANKLLKTFSGTAIISMAVLSVAIHLLVANNLEYHRDELLYFSLGHHPAAGYATVPPLIGWIAWFMSKVFGYSVFAVRLFPAILGGALIILTASVAKELGGSKYASFLAGLGLLVSIFFMRSYFLFQPVHIEIFLWTLSIFLILKYINTSNDVFILLFGIIAGISLLNKYLSGLLFLGLIIVVPFTRYRDVMRKKMFYAGVAAGFLIFLPNLIWQISNGFPVFSHISELYGTQLVYMDIPLFLSEQLVMPFAGTLFTVAGLIFLVTSKRIQKFRFIGFLIIFIIISLMLLKGKSYYTLGVFPVMIAAGALFYENWIRKKWLRIFFPLFLVLVTIPIIPIGIPVFKSEGLIKYFRVLAGKYGIDTGRRFEDGTIHSLPQDYADMLGWEELTSLADKAYSLIENKKSGFIYCENYGQAGAISVIGKKYGLPEAVCFSESFRYWIPEKFDTDITSLIYINSELGEDIQQLFNKITLIGMVSDPDAREYRTRVYLCENPNADFNEFWKERLKSLKEEN